MSQEKMLELTLELARDESRIFQHFPNVFYLRRMFLKAHIRRNPVGFSTTHEAFQSQSHHVVLPVSFQLFPRLFYETASRKC